MSRSSVHAWCVPWTTLRLTMGSGGKFSSCRLNSRGRMRLCVILQAVTHLLECWPCSDFDPSVNRNGGVHSLILCTSCTLGLLPASRSAGRENTYWAKCRNPSSQSRQKACWVITLCVFDCSLFHSIVFSSFHHRTSTHSTLQYTTHSTMYKAAPGRWLMECSMPLGSRTRWTIWIRSSGTGGQSEQSEHKI